MTLLYITCKDNQEARRISKILLQRKLIACANILPIESMFWWEGRLTEEKETLLLAKTKQENVKEIEETVKNIHSYQIPCIIRINTEENKEFSDWVDRVIN